MNREPATDREPSSTELQTESESLLSRIRPLAEAMDMAIRRNEAGAEDAVSDACREFKAIQRRFREVQRLIASGEATRNERVTP